MRKFNQGGYIEDWFTVIGSLLVIGLVILFFVLLLFSRIEWSEDNVSGIVYNTTNNSAISGNTRFSVRAAVDTYVSEENKSEYCLPPNSPYKELVNKAAANKNIKVQVTSKKGFWIKLPWTCVANITVTEVK